MSAIGLSDELLDLVVPDDQESTASRKNLKKKRSKRLEKQLDRRRVKRRTSSREIQK